jgi:hypothetical protein
MPPSPQDDDTIPLWLAQETVLAVRNGSLDRRITIHLYQTEFEQLSTWIDRYHFSEMDDFAYDWVAPSKEGRTGAFTVHNPETLHEGFSARVGRHISKTTKSNFWTRPKLPAWVWEAQTRSRICPDYCHFLRLENWPVFIMEMSCSHNSGEMCPEIEDWIAGTFDQPLTILQFVLGHPKDKSGQYRIYRKVVNAMDDDLTADKTEWTSFCDPSGIATEGSLKLEPTDWNPKNKFFPDGLSISHGDLTSMLEKSHASKSSHKRENENNSLTWNLPDPESESAGKIATRRSSLRKHGDRTKERNGVDNEDDNADKKHKGTAEKHDNRTETHDLDNADDMYDTTSKEPKNTNDKRRLTRKRAASISYTPPMTRGRAKKTKRKVRKA